MYVDRLCYGGCVRYGFCRTQLSMAVPALFDLVTRLPASAAHPHTAAPHFHARRVAFLSALFLSLIYKTQVCVATRQFIPALPVLANPITEVDTTLNPDLTYTDSLTYHYTAGIALAGTPALGRGGICLGNRSVHPVLRVWVWFFGVGTRSSGLRWGWGGWRRWRTRCADWRGGDHQRRSSSKRSRSSRSSKLISTGSARPTPRYSPPLLSRMMRGGAYAALANAFPDPVRLKEVVERESGVFEKDRNAGLVRIVCEKAPRWILREVDGYLCDAASWGGGERCGAGRGGGGAAAGSEHGMSPLFFFFPSSP